MRHFAALASCGPGVRWIYRHFAACQRADGRFDPAGRRVHLFVLTGSFTAPPLGWHFEMGVLRTLLPSTSAPSRSAPCLTTGNSGRPGFVLRTAGMTRPTEPWAPDRVLPADSLRREFCVPAHLARRHFAVCLPQRVLGAQLSVATAHVLAGLLDSIPGCPWVGVTLAGPLLAVSMLEGPADGARRVRLDAPDYTIAP